MAFRNLFLKELKSIFPVYGFLSAAVVLLQLVVLYKISAFEDDGGVYFYAIALMLPYLLAAVIAIGTGYYQLHTEWRTNSIYLLLSLPVRGWKVLSAKLAAVLSLLILTAIVITSSFILILGRVVWADLKAASDNFSIIINSVWMSMLVVLFLLVLVQFAFLCGQLVARFKWLVAVGAFISAVWLVLRISPLLSSLLLWTPDIFMVNNVTEGIYLRSGPFIVLMVIGVGFVYLNGLIFEREVEV